jgi:hypothetical protein
MPHPVGVAITTLILLSPKLRQTLTQYYIQKTPQSMKLQNVMKAVGR